MSLPGDRIRPVRIVPATEADVPLIMEMIRGLAQYERLEHMVVATEQKLRTTLFSERPADSNQKSAEVLLAYNESECAGIALFFSSYSTFLAQPGIFLEDIYVKPHLRGAGTGTAMLAHLAQLAVERGCGRLEWDVLDWNAPAIGFYKALGAAAMDEWTRYRLTGDALHKLAARR